MEITIEQLTQGLRTKIKDNEFFSAAEYVEPFLERSSKFTDNFIINVKPADQISLTTDGDINFDNIVYNRVNIEAVLPQEYAYEGHKQVLGLVYGIDTRKPVIKFYTGALRSACLNLCVFNPAALNVQELIPGERPDYRFVDTCMELEDDIAVTLKKLAGLTFDKKDCFELLGHWVDRCITRKYANDFGTIKLAESTPIEAYKSLFYDKKSEYFSKDNTVTGFQIYNAFTDIICNSRTKDLVNRFEKVQLVKQIMDIDSL